MTKIAKQSKGWAPVNIGDVYGAGLLSQAKVHKWFIGNEKPPVTQVNPEGATRTDDESFPAKLNPGKQWLAQPLELSFDANDGGWRDAARNIWFPRAGFESEYYWGAAEAGHFGVICVFSSDFAELHLVQIASRPEFLNFAREIHHIADFRWPSPNKEAMWSEFWSEYRWVVSWSRRDGIVASIMDSYRKHYPGGEGAPRFADGVEDTTRDYFDQLADLFIESGCVSPIRPWSKLVENDKWQLRYEHGFSFGSNAINTITLRTIIEDMTDFPVNRRSFSIVSPALFKRYKAAIQGRDMRLWLRPRDVDGVIERLL